MTIRIINSILILLAVFMAMKQGWAMASAKPEMLVMFSRWNVSKQGMIITGLVTMLSAVMMLFPRTFLGGNFLMAAGILLIICLELGHGELKGAGIEVPFLLLNLLIVYLQHPMIRTI